MEQGNRRGHLSILLLLLAVSVMEVYCTRELRIHVNLRKYHNPTGLAFYGKSVSQVTKVKGIEVTVYFTAFTSKSRGDVGQWRVPGLVNVYDKNIYFGGWPGGLPHDFAAKITPDMADGIHMEIELEFLRENVEEWEKRLRYDKFVEKVNPPENRIGLFTFAKGKDRHPPSEFQLDISVQVVCDEDHYYGPMCLVYCKPENSDNGHYICNGTGHKVCLDGWLDEKNDCNRTDECKRGHCMNGGTCSQPQPALYECSCPSHYFGDKCDVPCKPEDGDNGHYKCNTSGKKICHDGWLDEQNDCKRPNECTRGYCKNGGTCRPLQGEAYECSCPSTHNGDKCQTEVTICDETQKQSANCSIGGNCAVKKGKLICTCSIGFNGTKCEVQDDQCKTLQPCKNNGTCQSKPGGYTCQCTEGMTGTVCDQICGRGVQCNNTKPGKPRNSDLHRALEAWVRCGTRPLPWTLAVFIGAAVAVASRLQF